MYNINDDNDNQLHTQYFETFPVKKSRFVSATQEQIPYYDSTYLNYNHIRKGYSLL